MRASDDDRDAVLRILQDAHAAGRLSIEEFDQRQDAALAATHTDDLDGLIDDLPEGRRLPAGIPTYAIAPAPRSRPPVPTRIDEPRPMSYAVLSGRTVELEPGSPGLNTFAWWGGHDIYVADAMGPGAVVVLNVSAVMGGHDIYVPPGVKVIDECIAIMAGNDVARDAQGDGSNGTLVLRGFLWWAGSDVKLDTRGLQGQIPYPR